MKIDPTILLLDKKFNANKNIYFISGNEITLMNKTKDLLIKHIEKLGSFERESVKNIISRNAEGSLFNNSKIYIVGDVVGIDNQLLDELSSEDNKFIFFVENSPKIKLIKNIFLKRSDSFVLDCYELSQELKTKVIKYYLEEAGIKLSGEVFWNLVEKLDNKFMILEKELEKIKEIKKDQFDIKFIDTVISKNSSAVEGVFFEIFKNNQIIIKSYNKNISGESEVNYLYQFIKRFSLLILSHEDVVSFEKSVPKYLFREKVFLVELFKKYNHNKKKALSSLLFKTENTLRKNSGLSNMVGLRFLLNFKKISIS